MRLTAKYDREADAVYVLLSEKPYGHGRDIDDARRIDYAEDGSPIGVELLYVSQGVDIEGLPRADEIAEALKPFGLRQLA